jgi:hypothetical protein
MSGMDPFENSGPSYGHKRRTGSHRESSNGLLGQLSNVANDVGSHLRSRGTSWSKVSGYAGGANICFGVFVLIWALIRMAGHVSQGFALLLGASWDTVAGKLADARVVLFAG